MTILDETRVVMDQVQDEIKYLFELAGDLCGKRILEIGCGDGRLTWRYASQAAQVVAIDPNPEKIKRARACLPPELNDRVIFQALGLEEFAAQASFGAAKPFDLALLSWSL